MPPRLLSAIALAVLPLGACNSQDGGLFGDQRNTAKQTEPVPPTDANIVAVHIIKGPVPWLKFGPEGDQRPDGIKLTVYLESGTTRQGVYGEGTIKVTMYVVDKDGRGRPQRTAVKEWSYSRAEALPWLSRRRTAYGWGYGLRLPWGDAKVVGHEVQFVARFVRRDNAVITSTPVSERVPEQVTGGVQ